MLRSVKIPRPNRSSTPIPSTERRHVPTAMIALALACRPALLIADEPTTAWT